MGKTGKILKAAAMATGTLAAGGIVATGAACYSMYHSAKATGKEILELFREGPEEQSTAKEKPEQCASAEATPEKQENVPVKDGTAEVVSSEERTETERDEKD